MDNSMLTLQDYEKNKPGSWTLTIQNASNFWNQDANAQKLCDLMGSLFKEIDEKLPSVCVLRVIIVTSSVIEEYERLLSQTSRKARVDSPREGYLGGKVLFWGIPGKIDTFHSAIVIDEKFCAAALVEQSDECIAMIVHELAHIAEGYITHTALGEYKEDIYLGEWEKIKFSKANSVFSEFFAQIIAFPYYQNQETLQHHIDHAVDHLKTVTAYLDQEIARYRWHANMGELWPKAVAELSRVFDQIGRSLGLLICIHDEPGETAWKNFIDKIEEVSPKWVPVINEFRDALTNLEIETIDRSMFSPICKVVEHGYHAAGFVPELLEDETLYIKVPF